MTLVKMPKMWYIKDRETAARAGCDFRFIDEIIKNGEIK